MSSMPPQSIREYRLLAKLGEGGMGTVYKAEHTKLRRVVALKVLPSHRMQSPEAVARFEREIEAVGALDHPNIVRAFDAGEHEGQHYLVMEYVSGGDVSRLMQRHGQLAMPEACEIIRQAALGLQHAHRAKLVHRDLKPSNLMLTESGTVKILDLGLALLSTEGGREITDSGQIMGTIEYMAPEQSGGTHQVDIRADIYALGATLYKLLSGTAPFADARFDTPLRKMTALATLEPTPLPERRPDVPAALAGIVHRMLAKDPERRPATPDEVVQLLEPFAKGADLSRLAAAPGSATENVVESETQASVKSALDDTFPLGEEKIASAAADEKARPVGAWMLAIGAGLILLAAVVWLVQRGRIFDKPGPNANVPAVPTTNHDWTSLFDGQTLDGWRGLESEKRPSGWSVESQAIVGPGNNTCLASDDEFGNFELEFQWRLGERANGGVFYRWGGEVLRGNELLPVALELQIVDDERHPDGQTPEFRTGSVFGLYAPQKSTAKPAGHWNTARLVAIGGRVEHWLNGARVLVYDAESEDLFRRAAQSGFLVHQQPGFGKSKRGRIVLQSHSGEIEYRRLRIRRLPATAAAITVPDYLVGLWVLQDLPEGSEVGLRLDDGKSQVLTHVQRDQLTAAPFHVTTLLLQGLTGTGQELARLEGLTELRELKIGQSELRGAGLADLPKLEVLELFNIQHRVDNAAFEEIGRLSSLKQLDFNDVAVTDDGLQHLAGLPNLERLVLRGTKITDGGIDQLAGLANLVSLDVRDTDISAAALQKLQDRLPACQMRFKGGELPAKSR